ncbi:hypothetical protein Cgig2_004058 [Carnegiea gigantea]|uniref:Bifunctional inhibitor/plant lipid transfer protein/seed storage helical domain-containing protein n=1 Tax=Carnegiea gigantea TaxID=171969 RepID=A0A9Q1KSY0_9CARY|nr:hypothetical protein Cgig2_004058 [Carnegiea gigantea]
MASRGAQVCLVLLVVGVAWRGARAQPNPACTNVLMSMSSCLNYVGGNSSSPAPSCCSALSSVVQSQPQCLCAALNSGVASSMGISINQTRALQLPSACNVKTPPVSQCNVGDGAPTSAAAPAESPAGADKEPKSPASDVPSEGSGSKAVPSTPGRTSDGSITRSSLQLLAFVLVSCTPAFTML